MRLATMSLCCWLTLPGSVGAESAASGRATGPVSISAAANAVKPSLGVDVSYRLNPRVALAAQLTTLLIAHTDLSLRSRLFLLSGDSWGLYVGANLHGWYSPIVFKVATVAGTLEVGGEWWTRSGLILGFGAGGGLLRVPDHVDVAPPKPRWSRLPLMNLRVGKILVKEPGTSRLQKRRSRPRPSVGPAAQADSVHQPVSG
jgi:hypothetical protein